MNEWLKGGMCLDEGHCHGLTLEVRRRILELAHKAGKNGAHVGGSMSLVEILVALYASLSDGTGDYRDRVILSKGHGALALYAVLESIGKLSSEETDTFETNGTHFYAHAPRDVEKGLEFAGGSLSLGLSFAVGVAWACKRKGYSNRVYAIVGDGECDEGLVWEALMAAAHYRLANLTVIVDRNQVQLDGRTHDVMDTASLGDKFRAFGFNVTEVDGHDIKSLLGVISKFKENATLDGTPTAIIADTVKGKGVSFAEGQHSWHHNVLSDNLYTQALKDLELLGNE